jgi:hypothetical protein
MKTIHRLRSSRCSSQRGQAFLVIIVFVCLFLLAMLGVATDYTQIWARRQMVQVAADAACQAGAADLYVNSVNTGAPGTGGLTSFAWIPSSAGTGAFTCNSNSGSPPCVYAARNGYSGSNVSVSFPASISGVNALPTNLATPVPYIQVTVTDSVPMQFTQLVTNNPTVNISAKASCGVAPVNEPIPMVILHQTASSALTVTGTAKVTVLGGPQRAIQIDSSSTTAVNVNTTADTIDLHLAGPSNNGADFAVFGGPTSQPAGIDTGSGKYIYPSIPIGDPFAATPAPTPPPAKGTATPVPFGINGCPDPNGCVEFTAGDYTNCSTKSTLLPGAQGCLQLPYTGTNPGFSEAAVDWTKSTAFSSGTMIQPTKNNAGNYVFIATNGGTSGGAAPVWNQTVCTRQSDGTCSGGTTAVDGTITWRNIGVVQLNKLGTGIFDPGLYYIDSSGLGFGDGSTARVSTATGDGSDGVMFYFSTSGSVSVGSNSGNSPACTSASSGSGTPKSGCIVSYKTDGTSSGAATSYVFSQKLQCPSGSANPSQVPSSLDGNVLLGPCGGLNKGISTTYGSSDNNRGFLLFQRAAANPSWGGGGQFLSSGFLYFHSGSGSTCGSTTSCLTLQGGSKSQSYTLGDIVVDELSMGGNPQINMILNPTATFQVLKPTLLQ